MGGKKLARTRFMNQVVISQLLLTEVSINHSDRGRICARKLFRRGYRASRASQKNLRRRSLPRINSLGVIVQGNAVAAAWARWHRSAPYRLVARTSVATRTADSRA